MKSFLLIMIFVMSIITSKGQELVIEEGVGIGDLKIGQSFEELVNILGFKGDLKTYDDYLAEELFIENPDNALECIIGFDFYVKYQHLLTLPVSYVFFKGNVINQIKVSSFPEYYFSIARDTKTKSGLHFWATEREVEALYGTPDLEVDYDSFILNAYFYFSKGITFNLREDNYRTAHIYQQPGEEVLRDFKNQF